MSKITLFLDKRRPKSSGKFSLAFRISHFDDTRLIQSGLDLHPEEWDEKDLEVRKRPDRAFLNSDLHKKLSLAKTYLVEKINSFEVFQSIL